MFITVHAAAGALIGTELPNPYLAFAAGVLVHFLMDIIPHGDHELGKRFFGLLKKKISEEEKFKSLAAYGLVDYIILVLFLLYSIKNFYFAKDDGVVWAIVGSIVPDLLVALYVLTRSRYLKWFFDFHNWVHHLWLNRIKNDLPLKAGIAMQLAIMALFLILLNQINLMGPPF
ncbi:MAG: hypothetical protein WC517_01940 [Patescibacteria group bacterium]